MKKKILIFVYFITCFLIGSNCCYATSASIKSSSVSLVKGNNVTITYIINSDSPLVSIEGTLKCSGAGINTGIDLRFDDSSNSLYSKSYTLTVKPTTAGSMSCFSEGVRLTEMAKDNWQNISNKQIGITVNNPVVIPPKQYSSNNNLSNLVVEGYTLDKNFDKDVLEYNVEIPNGVEKITISASTADDKAKVSGIGEKAVVEGNNKIEIKVTAENGNVKTYVINAKVKELDPIVVKVENKEYTIVRKESSLDPIEGYEKSKITIGEDEVLSYYSETTKFDLVILKDEDGKEDYYIYEDGKYSLYKEYNFSGVKLYLINEEKPDNFIDSELTINNEKIKAYQFDLNNDNYTYALDENNASSINNYYLVHAMNVNTGNINYYLIDKLENTAIRYDKELSNMFLSLKGNDNYKIYFFVTIGILGMILIICGISQIVGDKKNKNKLSFK